jgi:hypothetical protein
VVAAGALRGSLSSHVGCSASQVVEVQSRRRSGTGGDGERHCEWKGDDGDRKSCDQVMAKIGPPIASAENRDELGNVEVPNGSAGRVHEGIAWAWFAAGDRSRRPARSGAHYQMIIVSIYKAHYQLQEDSTPS